VEVNTDCEYVVDVLKGTGMRPLVGLHWSDSMMWIACDGNVAEPRKRWARSAWRGRAKAHETLAEIGLAVAGQPTWKPLATALFDAPISVAPPPILAPVDEAAIARLAT
jgi:hypothetical protein